ncbi:MAG TPA: methyl-accepting chemotaxis protein [Methanospirillum sp.]|nr:methyl-accepting chemotaxis protein [Methanospirillum sp.]
MTAKILVTDATTLMNIIDATPASIQIIGQDGRYLDCNAATYTMFRARDSEDIIGKPPSILSPEKQSDGRDSMEGAAFYIKKALGGEDVSFEWEHMRLDGTVFPCKVTLKRIDYVGTPCLMATIVDITEVVALRKRSEFIIAHAPSPIVDVNPDLSIQYANHAFAALTDTPSEQLCRMKISDFDVRNRVGGSLTEALEKKSTVHGELDAHVKSGVRHLQYYYTPFFDQEGNLLSIFAYYFDKTAEISAVREIIHLTERSQAGDLDARVDPAPYSGELRILMEGINGTLDAIIGPLNVAAKWIEDVAKGREVFDITDEYPGDYAVIKNNINESNRVLKALVAETQRLSKGATAGDLSIRSDLTQYPGAWKDIVAGINETLESVVTPVHEAIRVADEYAQANFSARFDPSLKVAGEWVGFKQALDNIGIQICDAIGVINKQVLELASNAEEATASVEEVSAGSQQIAKNTGSVSANAEQGDEGITQVLKAMEDLTITVGEVSQRAEKVSTSASEANHFSKQGIELAKKSESAMNGIRLSTSEVDQIVKEINKQMEEIGKIVRLITDISNQTNLLALNAAIEAARAGEAGRGFAVVAAEVKSLAQDSRASAENIADMIANLQAKATKANDAIITAGSAVEDGNRALEETVRAFSKIADSIEDITKNAMDMASSSEEQAAAVEEITASVHEVSVLIQNTAREAQDAAAATEEASASIEQIGRVIANVSGIADNISREMTKFTI